MSTQKAAKKEGNIIYLDNAITPEKALKIIKIVKSEADSNFKHLLSGLMGNMSEAVFEEMTELDEQDSLERHFNIMRAIKSHQREFIEAFFKSMNLGWVNLLHRKDEQSVPDASGKAATEIERLQRKISIHYKILLAEVGGRFNNIAGQEMQYHPLMPRNIYLSFWAATAKLNLENEEREIIVALFNRFVMDKTGKLLGAVNDKLDNLGVEKLKVEDDQIKEE